MTHPIPIEAMDGKVGVLGITGSGKTFTAIGMVEQLLELGRQVIIIDPTGAYHGMRAAFPLPIFGGKAGDIPIGEGDGEAVARVIVDQKRSAIVDVSILLKESHAAARRFMGPFIATLKNSPAAPRYLVIDEADEFMPENASGDVTRLFGDLKWIVRRGRIEGWRVMMVTQRPQDIAKSVLTQCETMVIHKLTAPQDRKAIEEWVKGNADAGQAKEVLGSLARLENGEAWIWSPRHDLLVKARLPLNRSADTSRTPEAGDEPATLARLDPADLRALRAALLGQSDAAAAKLAHPAGADSRATAAAVEEIAALRGKLAQVEGERDRWREHAHIRLTLIERARAALTADGSEIPAQGGGGPEVDDGQTEGTLAAVPTPRATAPAPAARTATEKAGGGNASPAALAIAELLDRVNPARLTWSQAATMTGRKASGGNFNAARKWLRESGRIVEDGDLIRSASDAPEGLSRDAAIALWKAALTNPAPKMIVAFLARGLLTKDELGVAIGAAPRGGNFNNGLAQLRRNGLIIENNGIFRLADPLPGERA